MVLPEIYAAAARAASAPATVTVTAVAGGVIVFATNPRRMRGIIQLPSGAAASIFVGHDITGALLTPANGFEVLPGESFVINGRYELRAITAGLAFACPVFEEFQG